MRLDKLTTKSQEAVQAAQELAHQHSHQEVDGEHLAFVLSEQVDGIIPGLLQRAGIDLVGFKKDLGNELGRRARVQGVSSADLYLGNDLRQVLDAAQAEATQLGDEFVSTEHLLLGMLSKGGAALKRVFDRHKLKRDALLNALTDIRGNQRVTDINPEDKFQALEK